MDVPSYIITMTNYQNFYCRLSSQFQVLGHGQSQSFICTYSFKTYTIVIEPRATLFYELKLKARKVRKKIDLIWISGLDPIHHFRSIAQPGRTVLIISIVVSGSFFLYLFEKKPRCQRLNPDIQCPMCYEMYYGKILWIQRLWSNRCNT